MDKWEYYKLFREHLDDAINELKSDDFNWLLDRVEEDIRELQDD